MFDDFTQPWELRLIVDWVLTHGVRILVIFVAAVVVRRAAVMAIGRVRHHVGHGHTHGEADAETQRRASTIAGILERLVAVLIWSVLGMMLLRELSIDVMPVLTGAGIAGLAIGFGAQNLVRDVISGFFLILEDQVRVGDSARVNDITGTIEQVNLRTIVVRDGEGAVHMFPNGTVSSLANLSKQYSYAVVDVRVAYNENLDRVNGTLREIGEAMQRDPAWGPLVLEPIELGGIVSLADNVATLRLRFKTVPLTHGRVANELRKRVMTTFVKRGIRPYAPVIM
ncbi:MAG: mechanosensitive ion channel family protein [Acidobacteriaceae bacterium]|jgi:small conductance mechanosensitive channel|nr:mechanosensitive ion channel family protein [Acidobacteriaceae bacterium]